MTSAISGAFAIARLARASETPLFRVLVTITGAAVVGLGALWVQSGSSLILLGCATAVVVSLIGLRFDYLHPSVAFLVPWTVVLSFSVMPISTYSRPLDSQTILFILATIFVWMAATSGAELSAGRLQRSASDRRIDTSDAPIPRIRGAVIGVFFVLYALAGVNIAYSGFIPLLSLIATGNSSYNAFGIPSFWGAFLALANAMACLAVYLYLRSRDRTYLFLFLSIIALHVLCVTRQNVVTLLVEAFVIRSITIRRLSRVTMVVAFTTFLALFSMLGTLRSGSIGDVIAVRPQYAWIPSGFLWLYAYSYFNVLNLENMMTLSGAPYFDGSMWSHLLPSVLRPETAHVSYLQLTAMNVSSYMYPIYFDVGNIGVEVCTLFWAAVSVYWYRRSIATRQFSDIAIYACLFFCALLSFFVDFWFYLPVIFQVVFFKIFQHLMFRPQPRLSYGSATL